MHIVHISSELAPIAKVGGLGDVVYGLSKELARLGHHVHVILPKYDCIDYSKLQNLRVFYRDLWSYEGPYRYHNTVWSAQVENLSVFLIEPHHPNYFFSRGVLYGCPDDIDRFLYFSRAAMEFLFKSGLQLDVIHVHDWPTAIIPLLQKDMYQSLGWNPSKTVLTLHNLEHQGHCSPKNLSQTGLRGDSYLTPAALQDPNSPLLLNLLKGGIVYADALTTVSPSYEREIKTKGGGHGLEEILKQHQKKLTGILNGIDEDFWNPDKDPFLQANYHAHPPFSSQKWEQVIEKKAENKLRLREQLGLEMSNAPLVACVTRLVPQKGPLLIAHAFRHILSAGAQCVILGSLFSDEMRELFSFLKAEYLSSSQGALLFDYNEPLAHMIYAAADILLVPSLFEPCGLSQMIALRYGCVPIVRKTGGLGDTIFEGKNGFIFQEMNKEEFNQTIDRAIALYKQDKIAWQKLMQKGMSKDYSWHSAAKDYLQVYQESNEG